MIRYASLAATAFAVLLANPLAAQEARAHEARSDLQASISHASTPPVTPAPTSAAAPMVATPLSVGPTMQASVAGVRTQVDVAPPFTPVAAKRVGRNPALMIVGGAAIAIGSIIGDDAGTVIMVGGAVTLLFGLWNFLH